MSFLKSFVFTLLITCIPLSAFSHPKDTTPIKNVIKSYFNSEIKAVIADPLVLEDLKIQSKKFDKLSRYDFVRLNDKWESEVKANTPIMMQQLLKNDTSKKLRTIREKASGLIISAALVDKHSVSVGQTGVSKSYWYTEDLVLHSLLRRKTRPSHYISEILYNNTSHFFYIRAYFVMPYENDIAILIVDFDAEEVDAIAHINTYNKNKNHLEESSISHE